MSSISWKRHAPIATSDASTAMLNGREKSGGRSIGRDASLDLRSRNAASASMSQTNFVPYFSIFVRQAVM